MNNDIFKRFGASSRRVLVASQKIALSMNSALGSEHLLLALSSTPNTVAYDILKEHHIILDQIRLIMNFNNLKTTSKKGLTSELKNILEIATKKTYDSRHAKIETEHLLWAICQKPDSLAYQIILRIGGEPREIGQDIDDIFSPSISKDLYPETALGSLNDFLPSGLDGTPFGQIPFGPQVAQKTASKNKSATPTLDEFGVDLTSQAKSGKLDPVIGREKEIRRTIQILCRRTKNNPVLVGDPGVGKTAIVEGISQRIAANNVPPQLKSKRVIMLDLSMVVAGTMYRGQFEDRLKKIIQEIIKTDNVILFIDEIHTIIGAGSAEGSMDAANILKPQLSKGQVRLIGATTTDEYRKVIERDAALERRLQKVEVEEPSVEETYKILQGVKSHYEEHHGVQITDEALVVATKLSKRYISDRFLPDKAIDLIDEAASATHLAEKIQNGDKLADCESKLTLLIQDKEQAIESQNFPKAALIRQKELQLKEELAKLKQTAPKSKKKIQKITGKDIADVVSLWTGVPVTNLVETEKIRLVNLEKILKKKIIGQTEAISAIAHAIRRTRSGIANPTRPIGAFIFLGPTGVGKSELAKVLSAVVFGSEENLIKIDMSEFMERHNVSRLLGAPPGYVGYEEAGKLTEAVRRKPYSVILFDEIEKAHPEVFNILLQIFEDGYVTDARGRKVNFRNTIIILTSNIGLAELTKQAALGFKATSNDEKVTAEHQYAEMKEKVLDQLKHAFRPEFINRLDKTIVFRPLDKISLKKIAHLQMAELIERVRTEKINLTVEEKVYDLIVEKGYDPTFGARPIRRALIENIEDPMSDKMLSGEITKGDTIRLSVEKGKIVFHHTK